MMNKHLQTFWLGLAISSLTACGIPDLNLKSPETRLPDQFKNEPLASNNASNLKWRDFFSDPNLVKLIDVAVQNNKEINILMQRISMSENEIQARRGAYLPMVKVGALAGAEKPGWYTFNGAVERNLPLAGKPFPNFVPDYQFGLFSSWEIDIWRKLRNATEVAVLDYMASIEGRNFLVSNLVAEVAHAYYELITLDNQLENLDQNIAIQQNALDMIRQLRFYARTDTLAVRRYEAEVAKNQSRRFEIKQELTVVENRINYLLGRTPEPIERNSGNFLEIEPKLVQSGVPSQLLQNRPDIKQAEFELAASLLNIEIARAEFLPSFGIRAGVGYDAFAFKYLVNTPASLAAMVAGELVAPLINKQAIIAQFKNANAQQIEAAYEYEKRIINAYVEVANQIANMENMHNSFTIKRKQVDALVNAIDVSIQLFKSARVQYLDVLTTQRDALDAKREMIDTKSRQIFAMIDLYKSLGGGWQ